MLKSLLKKEKIIVKQPVVVETTPPLPPVLDIDPSNLRVITTDVGGGFGMKIFNYPEYILSLYASKKVSRPVKWISERTEAFVSDTHGRDHVTKAKMALDKDGIFTGIKTNC